MMMGNRRYSGQKEPNIDIVLQDLFKFTTGRKIAFIIIAIMVIVGHVWLGCR